MYNVDIVLIRPDFVWLSRPVAPITCGIVLVQDASGNFLGTKTKNPVYIGLVPKISLPDPNVIRSKLHKIRHQSTPNRPIRSQNEAFRQFGGGISPIVEMGSRKSQANKEVVARQNLLGEDSSSSTSASTSLLRRHISKFEQQNLSQTAENSEEANDLSTTIDPNEAFVEDRQRNDIESSHDQENTPTSDTKDDSGQMSGTFDVGGTDSSTLVNNQSKDEQDTTTTTRVKRIKLKLLIPVRKIMIVVMRNTMRMTMKMMTMMTMVVMEKKRKGLRTARTKLRKVMKKLKMKKKMRRVRRVKMIN